MNILTDCAIILFMKKIILASGSPRRRELLKQIGLDFEVIVSECEENSAGTEPEVMAGALSRLKCMSVAEKISTGSIEPSVISDDGYVVIGSDTVVAINGRVLGKPSDEQESFEMLKLLSGNVHTVFTGVTIFDTLTSKTLTFTEHTDVKMFPLDDTEILEYITTKEPMDKAGAYGIQGRGATLVERIHGDYFTVVGLPVARLARELKKFM